MLLNTIDRWGLPLDGSQYPNDSHNHNESSQKASQEYSDPLRQSSLRRLYRLILGYFVSKHGSFRQISQLGHKNKPRVSLNLQARCVNLSGDDHTCRRSRSVSDAVTSRSRVSKSLLNLSQVLLNLNGLNSTLTQWHGRRQARLEAFQRITKARAHTPI